MRKEEFFELLGELDGALVEKAGAPAKWRINRRIPGIMAACLALLCVAFGYVSFTGRYGSSPQETPPMEEAPAAESPMPEAPAEEAPREEDAAGDIAPMVYVNDALYIQSSVQKGYTEWQEEFSYLGKIQSVVSSNREPEENFQANDPIAGCEVYQYGGDIVVRINGSYWLYVKYDTQGASGEQDGRMAEREEKQ